MFAERLYNVHGVLDLFCEISDYRQMGGVISGMIVVIFTTWYDSFVLIRKPFPLGI